jgi:hypothetical protein
MKETSMGHGHRWTESRAVTGVLFAALLGLCFAGCYEDNCALRGTCFVPCPLDPADTPWQAVDAACGVWASSSAGDDGNAGTPRAPVATLSKAIALAVTTTGRVYACAEQFDGKVELPAGISLFGGFDCGAGRWGFQGPARTKIRANPDEIPLVLLGSARGEPSLITDLDVRAEDASLPGGSSMAVLARAGANADLRRSYFRSGRGADGADGEGEHLGPPAAKGQLGNSGEDACTALFGSGGDMVAQLCDDGSGSEGGAGGDGGDVAANDGSDGGVAPVPNPQGFGRGGWGEDLMKGLSCKAGVDGAPGAKGEDGQGAHGHGYITNEGYVGRRGDDGQHGFPGQGGGGGGGSAGSKLACGAGMPLGGSGGGAGGSGGCGGKGGKGGQPGGASIALATLSTSLTTYDVELEAGDGGRGGHGAPSGKGAQGGLPGMGGAGWGSAHPGCPGGSGGHGGDGGHGGGGLGGPSIGFAYATMSVPSIVFLSISLGAGGDGGLGGDPQSPMMNGQAGIRGPVVQLLP